MDWTKLSSPELIYKHVNEKPEYKFWRGPGNKNLVI